MHPFIPAGIFVWLVLGLPRFLKQHPKHCSREGGGEAFGLLATLRW